MNIIRILKDNTDYLNDRDKLNATVEGTSVLSNPFLKTTPTALAAATTIPDYVSSGIAYNNTGAVATLEHLLPAAAISTGTYIGMFISAAQIARIQPASGESIYAYGSGVADKYLNIAGVIGNYAVIWCDGTSWYVIEANGVLTKEA